MHNICFVYSRYCLFLCQQFLDGDKIGKYYRVYYDEGRYRGRFLNVSAFYFGLYVKGAKFCWLYCLVYTTSDF